MLTLIQLQASWLQGVLAHTDRDEQGLPTEIGQPRQLDAGDIIRQRSDDIGLAGQLLVACGGLAHSILQPSIGGGDMHLQQSGGAHAAARDRGRNGLPPDPERRIVVAVRKPEDPFLGGDLVHRRRHSPRADRRHREEHPDTGAIRVGAVEAFQELLALVVLEFVAQGRESVD